MQRNSNNNDPSTKVSCNTTKQQTKHTYYTW